jgi:hypothetical protein
MFLQQFSYTIVHVKGEDKVVADGLSRLSLQMIQCIIRNDSLQMIQRIIHTTVDSGIGIAPAQLVFASHADLDGGILFDWATPDEQAAVGPPAQPGYATWSGSKLRNA